MEINGYELEMIKNEIKIEEALEKINLENLKDKNVKEIGNLLLDHLKFK